MSNTDASPDEVGLAPVSAETAARGGVQVVEAREVPLGGPRAIMVRRTLPSRERALVGAWCFADHYGPAAGRMDVPPHPHSGLQTVSWLFSGEVEHRDSLGTHALIRPGEMNLMTSGRGIAHSEVSTDDSAPLHGVQLWVALPAADAVGPRDFAHLVTEPVPLADAAGVEVSGGTGVGGEVRVFLGELAGSMADVPSFSPLLGAEFTLQSGTSVELSIDPTFEHGVLLDRGVVSVEGSALDLAQLGYVPAGRDSLRLVASGDEPARLLLLGGAPFEDDLVMWWNFVGRTHDDIVEARREWQDQSDRFGRIEGYSGPRPWLPAPELPPVQLKPRRRP